MSERYQVDDVPDGYGTCEPREEGELVQDREYGATACDTSQNTGKDHDNDDWSISGVQSARHWRPAQSRASG